MILSAFCFFFFFSSRRRHTRWPRDWSSDVCSSDLKTPVAIEPLSGTLVTQDRKPYPYPYVLAASGLGLSGKIVADAPPRSEERRVGKECRSRGWPDHEKKKEANEIERKTWYSRPYT